MNKERGNILVIAFGVLVLLFIISFFKTERRFFDTFNLTAILRLPCGLTVTHPKGDETKKPVFPLVVDGYVNACGWERSGTSAGTAQLFDGKGNALTIPTPMTSTATKKKPPYSFVSELELVTPPTTDEGNILLISTTGLISSIPIAF